MRIKIYEKLNIYVFVVVTIEQIVYLLHVCDMIKVNESLVKNFNFNFLAPLSHNFNMLHFDPNLVTIGYLVTELYIICQCYKGI